MNVNELSDKEYSKKQNEFLIKLKKAGFKEARAYPRNSNIEKLNYITDNELLIIK